MEDRRGPSALLRGWQVLVPSFLVLNAGALLLAWYALFSTFQRYDDEGYLMLTVRLLMNGQPLYDRIVTPYGPSYYFLEWVLHRLLRVPLTNDAARFVSAGLWLLVSTLCAVSAWLLTRAWSGAVVAYVAAFFALFAFVNEPGHPQELVGLLLATALVLSLLPEGRKVPWVHAALGATAGALVLVKVNVGAFLILSLIGASASCLISPRGRNAILTLAGVFATALPWLLTHDHLERGAAAGGQWFAFSATASLATLAVWVASWRPEPRAVDPRLEWPVLAGCLLAATAAAAFALATGSTLTGLVESLVLTPRRFAHAFGLPPPLEPFSIMCAGAGALTALAATFFARRVGATVLIPIKLVYGALVVTWAMQSQAADLLRYAGGFAWIVLQRTPDDRWSASEVLGRRVLAWVAVLQMLQAYPVAGSQTAFGTFALVPIAIASLWDGVRALAQVAGRLGRLVPWVVPIVVLAAIAGPTAVAFEQIRKVYSALEPLGLPGAERVRIDPRRAAVYRKLASVVRDESDTFVCTIGLNSLYIWSGKMPPSSVVIGNDVRVLTDDQQHEVIRSLLEHPRGIVIFHPPLVSDTPESVPFFQDIARHFQPSQRIGNFTVLVQRKLPGALSRPSPSMQIPLGTDMVEAP